MSRKPSEHAGQSGAHAPGSSAPLRAPLVAGVGLTLVLRLVYLLTTENPFWRALGLDLEIYDLWAKRILDDPPFGGDVLGQAPFFPLALSLAYAVLGPDPVRALFVHLLPAVFATGAIVWVAGRWRGTTAAWIAGVLAALHGPSIFYTGVLLPPTWALALSALVLALGYRLVAGEADRTHPGGPDGAGRRSGSRKDGRSARATAGRLARIGVGLALGLLAWAQPAALLLLLPLLVFAAPGGTGGAAADVRSGAKPGRKTPRVPFWRADRAEWRRLASTNGWILAGLAVPLLLSFAYNASRGAPALIAVNGGINFYIGNGPEATGAYQRPRGMEENRDLLGVRLASRRILAERARAEAGVAERATSGEVAVAGRAARAEAGAAADTTAADGPLLVDRRRADRYWWNEGLRAAFGDPLRAVGLYARKLGFFFTNYEIPQVESLPFESRYSWLLRLPLPGMALLVFGTVLGAALLAPRDRVARWLLASIAVLALSVAVFFVTARFRLPVVPWMIVLSAAGGADVWARLRGRRVAAARTATDTQGASGGGAAAGLDRSVLIALAVAVVAGAVSAFAPTGIVTEATEGQYLYRQAVIAEQSGDVERAIAGYRGALTVDPNLAKANVNLGTLLARRGERAEARGYLERGVALDPTSGIGHQNLGQLHEVEGRLDEALAQYEAAIAAEPDLISVREGAAYLLHTLGRVDESRRHLETILRRVPKGSPHEVRTGTLYSLIGERRAAAPGLVAGGARAEWWTSAELLRADVLLAQRQIAASAEAYRQARTDPSIAPYADLILTQLEASGALR